MAIKKFEVTVTQTVLIEIDDEKINDDFNKVFSEFMFPASCCEDHAEHLAQMEARGLIGFDKFVEGYGDIRSLNCKATVEDTVAEVEAV